MIYRIVVIIACSLTVACSTLSSPDNSLISSLNVGVLADDSASKDAALALLSSPAPGTRATPNQVRYLPVEQLQKQLNEGELDVAVGLLVKGHSYDHEAHTQSQIKPVLFQYFIAQQNAHLSRFTTESTLIKHVKAIGFVSDGANAALNRAAVALHNQSYLFVPCGNADACKTALQAREIDLLYSAITADEDIYNTLTLTQDTVLAVPLKTELSAIFYINPRSLSDRERDAIYTWIENRSGD